MRNVLYGRKMHCIAKGCICAKLRCPGFAFHNLAFLNDVRVLAPASQQESTPQQHRPEDMTGTLVYKACM